jgi:hypothetical protein
MENNIQKEFVSITQMKLDHDTAIIAAKIDKVLEEYKDKKFELSLGFYDSDGYSSQYTLNEEPDFEITGYNIVQEVIDFFYVIDFTAVTAVKIYFDEPQPEYNGWDNSLVEFDGYQLDTEL